MRPGALDPDLDDRTEPRQPVRQGLMAGHAGWESFDPHHTAAWISRFGLDGAKIFFGVVPPGPISG